MKARTLKVLQGIQGKAEGYEKEVAEIDEAIFDMFKPIRYDGGDGKEVQFVKQFEKACSLLTKHMNIQQPEKLPTRKFYLRLADLKEQFKPETNGRQKRVNTHQRHTSR